jgi:putative tricarboxylic transport membrane protein
MLVTLVFTGCGESQENYEFVACYGPGGGHDTMLRQMQKVIQDNELTNDVINVVNKEGGSGAVGMGYVKTKEGNGNYLMAATSSILTTPLQVDNLDVSYKDFTPIARLAVDPSVLIVNKESPLMSIEDIKSAGESNLLNVAGTGKASLDNIVAIELGKEMGIEINYIAYESDAEIITAVLGGEVDFGVSNPNTTIEYIKNGDFRCYGISTEERVDILPEVPTFIEQGLNVDQVLFRGVMAPGNISDEEIKYLTDLVVSMTETEDWQKNYIEPNALTPGLLIGEDFKDYLEKMNISYEKTFKELGIIK